ncbi:hypothetical protein [Streptomyces sp. NPDC005732]|uniref:hypothetical protein n=1 Tax=Streptomyces sp. NPDC005732 TaxID=3157057 RepID=UPI0033CEEB0E
MGEDTERAALPLVVVHGAAAADARRRVAVLLAAAGARPDEVRRLIAGIEAGAVEGAGESVVAMCPAPAEASAQFEKGWYAAIESTTGVLADLSDRTVRQAAAASDAHEASPPASSAGRHVVPASVDDARAERIPQAAERIYVSLTGYTGFDRDLSREILPVVLKCLSADEVDGYEAQLEAFAESQQGRLAQLYALYGPGGSFADESRCYLPYQPESVVVCERLSTVPMWLEGVWNDELDAELTLERFTKFWRFGLDAVVSGPQDPAR